MKDETVAFLAARMTPERQAIIDAFFADADDCADFEITDPADCPETHQAVAGVNMDIGSCPRCWMPVGVMRPYGESFGWHSQDCSLPLLHPGYCQPGGAGHIMPEGWKLRG